MPSLLLGPLAGAVDGEFPERRRITDCPWGSCNSREQTLPPRTIIFGLGERFLRGIAPPRVPRQKSERPGKGRRIGKSKTGAPTLLNLTVGNCADCA